MSNPNESIQDELIRLASDIEPLNGNMRCVNAVLKDYRVHTIEDLENLPMKSGGRVSVCGIDIFQFIRILKSAYESSVDAQILEGIPVVETSVQEEEE